MIAAMSTPLTRRTALQALAATVASPWLPRVSVASQTVDPSARLRELIAASEAAANALDPTPRTRPSPGAPVFVDPLGEAAFDAVRSGAERDLAGLHALDRAQLTPVERIAYDVLEYASSQQLDRYRSGLAEVTRRVPLDATGGLHIGLPDYVSGAGAPFVSPEDYAAGLERLRGFTGYLDSLVQQLRDGQRLGYHQPRVVVAKVIAQADAMLALPVADTPFMAAVKRFPDGVPTRQRASFAEAYGRVVEKDVLPAYRHLARFLESDYLPQALEAPGRWAMKDGERLYAAELQHHTTVDVTADELHAIGVEEVARYRDGMEAVRGRVGFKGDLADFFEFIRKDPRFYYTQPGDLLARFREIEQQIWIGMPRLFARRPQAPFEVRALPAIGEQRGTGYYRPGPPDGKSPGVLWFNMAMLGTRPIPTLETLTLHEGIPGHHYQITLAQEDATLPDNLRFGTLTAYSEGWGLYSESLGSELGLFTDPYQYFGHLDMGMLRAVRLVVDTGLHAGQWTRQKAIDYMLANTSMAQRDVEVEIDRYITRPAQACAYKTGELRIRALRDEAARNQGTGFDVKDFHGQVLDTGALPLAVLERKVRAWCCAG
jgi:uncharacterized protein (DUF885 family)